MSTRDDLRDRIAAVIARGYEPDHPAPNRHDYRAADSVIDDLGLTVEERAYAPAYDGGHVYYNTEAANNGGAMGAYVASLPVESRVVGRWVKNHAARIEKEDER